jgi:ABC-type transport system substrate-binding protein
MKLVRNSQDPALDELTWEVKLRKGVKFHNGEDFNSAAVKFTLDRVRVAGATQVSSGFTTIDDVKTPDPHTVHIITKKPDPLLPARLAAWGAQMLPPGYFKEVGVEGLARKAVGTGPYRFGEWRKVDSLSFEANASYWGDESVLARSSSGRSRTNSPACPRLRPVRSTWRSTSPSTSPIRSSRVARPISRKRSPTRLTSSSWAATPR